MLALMLDPHFKSFDVMEAFIGQAKMILKLWLSMIIRFCCANVMIIFHFLNPTTNGLIEATPTDDGSILGAMTSNVVTLHGFLNNELGLFHHFYVKRKDFIVPWTWWKSHETRFSNLFLWLNNFWGFLGPKLKLK
jgi:hypothetical protein